MKCRVAVLALVTSLAGTPAAASHESLCERFGAEETCESVPELEERYLCWAFPSMSAERQGTQADEVEWHVRAQGFHGCPNAEGDIVRVTGTLKWSFGGAGLELPLRICHGYGTCETDSDVYQIWAPPIVAGFAKATSTSAYRSDGTAVGIADYVFT